MIVKRSTSLSDLVGALVGAGMSARLLGEDVAVRGVTHDSRAVTPGDLFVAVEGRETDGHQYVDLARDAGAMAVAVSEPTDDAGPQIVVEDTRLALAELAAEIYGRPSRSLDVVGVTGTNGKTTVTHLLESIGRAAGIVTGIVGTVGARIGDGEVPVARTTPEASELQRLLADMHDGGVGLAAIEVSSHALALHRVDAVDFRAVAFTNLSQDHLDFHADLDEYREVKTSLFIGSRAASAIVCIDDATGRSIAASTSLPTTTVATSRAADIMVEDVRLTADGSRFVVAGPGVASFEVEISLPGHFNVQNALVAAGIGLELGIDANDIASGLGAVGPIPGRFESIDEGQTYLVIVDYAHTPEAVRTVIAGTRPFVEGRIVVVLGAGGDRDREKRPLMGMAAASADVAVITSDNPRSEDPRSIVGAIASAARTTERAVVIEEPDRRLAIRLALEQGEAGDAVLILGKGHEPGQEVAGRVLPFDDRSVARRELRSLRTRDAPA